MFGDGSVYDLERQYSPSYWSQRLPQTEIVQEHLNFLLQESISAKLALVDNLILNVSYSNGKFSRYDVFFPTKQNITRVCPVLVYIHGGYWSMMGKEFSAFWARSLTSKGVIYVALGYGLAPEVSLESMIKNIREGVISVVSRFSPRDIFICGHSAGAHLAALLFQTEWMMYGYSMNPISGFFLISGIYQLEPIILTNVNTPLHLTTSSAKELSPLLNTIPPSSFECLIIVITCENDSPAFKYQSKLYYEFTKKFPIHSIFLSIPNVDHFDIVERLVCNNYILSNSIDDSVFPPNFSMYMHEDLSLFINDYQIS